MGKSRQSALQTGTIRKSWEYSGNFPGRSTRRAVLEFEAKVLATFGVAAGVPPRRLSRTPAVSGRERHVVDVKVLEAGDTGCRPHGRPPHRCPSRGGRGPVPDALRRR